MGLIDHAKRIRDLAVDRLHPQPVVFHHVPKCGGTSVGRALRRRYLLSQATVIPESSFRALEAFTGCSDREKLLVDVLDLREQMLLYLLYERVRCISAHVRFSRIAHARFAGSYSFVTILREPVSRFVSNYRWSHGKPDAHARIEQSFEQFLDTPRARRLGATYVEFFSGLPKDSDFTSDEAIAAAIETLGHLDAVGMLDDLDGFSQALEPLLGVRLRIGHENRATPHSLARAGIDDAATRAKVEELCRPDLAVWHAVRKTARGCGQWHSESGGRPG